MPQIVSSAKDINYEKYIEGDIDEWDDDLINDILEDMSPLIEGNCYTSSSQDEGKLVNSLLEKKLEEIQLH